LSPIDSLLPPLRALLVEPSLLGALARSPLPLLLERERGLAIRRPVDGLLRVLLRPAASNLAAGLLRSAVAGDIPGQFGMLLNGPLEPTGCFSTTPGFVMLAAMTSGSWLSFAAPWWKRLQSAPHASRAAFIEGAAACLKKPSDVW
jgi:hypothetical protein